MSLYKSVLVFFSVTAETAGLSPANEKETHTNNRLLMDPFTSRVSSLAPLFRVRSPGSSQQQQQQQERSPSCRILEVVSAGRTWSLLSPSPSDRREAPVQSCVRS